MGSQLPDIDTTTSTIGKIFFPISSWIEDKYPHRIITHSLLAIAAITTVSFLVTYFVKKDINLKLAIAIPFRSMILNGLEIISLRYLFEKFFVRVFNSISSRA